MGLTPLAALCSTQTAQDTINPVFTTPPQDDIIACDGMVELTFEDWYDNQAFSQADNGEANVFPNLPLNLALDSLERVIEEGCMGSGAVEIGFFAIDSCGNQSAETLIGRFEITDDTKPTIDIGATNLEILCTSGSVDSLENWINTQGGAEASDNCGSVTWKNYVWTDDIGNQGFVNVGDPTNIIIQRTNCEWSVTVSFFVEDDCGNDNVTTAMFAIIGDEERPAIISTPNDTTLLCGTPIPLTEPTFQDNCDPIINVMVTDSLTQVSDRADCAHYNYEFIRTWVASDACQNIEEVTTTYFIVDTVAPTIIFDATIAVNCDIDLTANERFVTVDDDCSAATITFRDSLLFSSTCQSQLIRTWIATDVCKNQDSVQQTIQIQDFSGPTYSVLPRDTIISCQTTQKEIIFNNWLNQYGASGITDNCNQHFAKQLAEGVYSDTSTISDTETITYDATSCEAGANGTLGEQAISFLAYDNCGNITNHVATFTIVDTIEPTILNCPTDFSLQVNDTQCAADYFILLPSFTDNCLELSEAQWRLGIDNDVFNIDQQGIEVSLGIGTHQLSYILSDCGGNTASCFQEISVFDNAPPVMTCPADLTLYTADTDCISRYRPEPILSYFDNCVGELAYEQTLPSESGLLDFSFNAVTDIYQVSDFRVNFEDVIFNGLLSRPVLEIEYAFLLDQTSRVTIQDEQENILHIITEGNCEAQKVIIELSEEQFKNWALDEIVRFTIINEFISGLGTIPCEPSNISGIVGKDNVSFLRMTLGYSDIQPDLTISNTQTGGSSNIINTIDLEPGSYITRYEAADAVNNLSSCLTNVEVLDTISPTVSCEDIVYSIDPLLENFYPILETGLDFSALDNCEIATVDFSPRQVRCADLNQELRYEVQVMDASANSATCSAVITTELVELNPDFVSNLCQADTLRLFSNLPDNIGLDFLWTGPNGFNSTQNNPIITGINEAFSGTYQLQASTATGCAFSGSLEIDVTQFDSPDIFSNANTICNGEELLLNTNSFTETVEYFWYEGISPNGTLIGRTQGPSLSIQPTTGTHFYYVEVQGNNCNSNPSNTSEILVTPPPIAEITEPFITKCEGEDIVLMTDVFDPNFEYEWSGPNNYSSIGQFPDVIENITESNQGNYTLIIKDGGCVSDTAISQVIIFEAPDQPIIDGENIFCEGQSAVLTVPNLPNGTKYQWFNNGLFFRSVSSNSLLIPAITSSQSGEWTVIVEEGICSSDTSEVFEINIESSLNIGASNNGPLCEGEDVELTSSFIPGATYTWQDPAGATYDGRIVTAPAIEGVYTVTITTASNCEATTNTIVEVGLRPTITALSNTSLPCMSGTMPVTLVPTVFPTGNYVYSWSGPNGYTSNLAQPVLLNVDESDNGNYILTVFQGVCASTPVTTVIDINNNPVQPIIIGNETPCEGVDITLTVSNPVTNSSAIWLWTTPSGTIETSEPHLELSNFNPTLAGNYTVVQTDNGCPSMQSEIFEVNIQTEPITPIINGDSDLCEGDDLLLTVTTLDANEYIWFTPNGTITTAENRLEVNEVSIADAGGYRVFLRDGNCVSDTSSITNISVNILPEKPTFENSLIELCADDLTDFELCINNSFELSYDLLRLIDLATGTTIQETETDCFQLDFLLDSDDNIFNLTSISSLNNCTSENSETLTIRIFNALQAAAQVAEDTIYLCNQNFTTITAQVPNTVEITWESTNPDINIFDETSNTPSFSDLPLGPSTILVNSSNGVCSNFATDTIIVYVIESITATDDQYDLSFNEEIILQPLDNDLFSNPINITLESLPDDGEATIEGQNISYLPPQGFVGTEEITYNICYHNCPDLCDEAIITLTIGVNVDCFVGNVITPNGDGYNDKLTVPCLQSGNFDSSTITIFNQWGDEIFSAAPYENDWEGSYNGKVLPVGTYFYILDLGNGSKPLQGFITLEL